VACRSLADQEIEQEQTTIRYAIRAIWVTHDFLCELTEDSGADAGDDDEGREAADKSADPD